MNSSERFLPRAVLSGLCCLLLLVSALAWPVDRGDTLAQTQVQAPAGQAASLRVLWVASAGWAEPGADGQPAGMSIELMHEFGHWLAQEHGLQIVLDFVEETDWRRFYARVREADGGVFGLGNVTITEARRSELAFSPPYVNNVAVLITHAGRPEISHPHELPELLAGRRALAFAGTLHEQRLRALQAEVWPELPMDFSQSNRDIVDAVAADSHFAYIDAYNYLQARAAGAPLRRHPALDDPGERFGVIMPLGNDWQDLLEEFFARDGGLAGQAWYRAALDRHLGPDIAELMRVGAQ